MAGRTTWALSFFTFLCCPGQFANAAEFVLDMTWGYKTPDCVERDPMVLINGQFPGPTLRVKAKEPITVVLKNHLSSVATTLHWHGVDQVGNPWADGAAGTSECPLSPGQERTYSFLAPDKPGTHYYHGHVGLAKESGAFGILLVDAEGAWPASMAHDVDIPFMIQDWYHGPALTYKTGLLMTPFRWAGDPQSILVNGQGHFDCHDNAIYSCVNEVCSPDGTTLATAFEKPYYLIGSHHKQCRPQDCPGWFQTQFQPGKRHFFRIVNSGTLSLLNVAMQGHTMTVVELDGEPVVPIVVTSVDLHVGQRVGLIVVADQPPGVYWVSIKVRGRSSVRFGAAVIRYTNAPQPAGAEPDPAALTALQNTQPGWDDIAFTLAQQRAYEHPEAAKAPVAAPCQFDDSSTNTISIMATQEFFAPGVSSHVPNPLDISKDPNLIGVGAQRPENNCDSSNGNILKWGAARVHYKSPVTPVLHSLYYQTPSMSQIGRAHGYFMLQPGQVYDIVLQNYPACNGACETHPWHLHGHHFWHVGTWEGEFDGTVPAAGTGGKMYRRDTIMIVGEGHAHKPAVRKGCGYTVIRFVADNPGAWPFHCHAEWHQIMGMGVVFYYPSNTIPPPNRGDYHNICGDVTPEQAAAKHKEHQAQSKYEVRVSWTSWLPQTMSQPILLAVAGVVLAITALFVKRRWHDNSYAPLQKVNILADVSPVGASSGNEGGDTSA